MKLYLSHASDYDYKAELYEPLKASLASKYDIFFPHDEHEEGVLSKDIIPTCDVVLAEVSLPSTGQGIELGWADAKDIQIICIHRTGNRVSSALRFISSTIIEYDSQEKMVEVLSAEIKSLS